MVWLQVWPGCRCGQSLPTRTLLSTPHVAIMRHSGGHRPILKSEETSLSFSPLLCLVGQIYASCPGPTQSLTSDQVAHTPGSGTMAKDPQRIVDKITLSGRKGQVQGASESRWKADRLLEKLQEPA